MVFKSVPALCTDWCVLLFNKTGLSSSPNVFDDTRIRTDCYFLVSSFWSRNNDRCIHKKFVRLKSTSNIYNASRRHFTDHCNITSQINVSLLTYRCTNFRSPIIVLFQGACKACVNRKRLSILAPCCISWGQVQHPKDQLDYENFI